MFEKASKLKLRFKVTNGNITTEDLWSYPLETLDILAQSLHREIKENGETSFIRKTNNKNEIPELKFAIVKHIIDVKLAEIDTAQVKSANRKRRDLLLQALEDKQNAELLTKSKEDILKELSELD